MTANAGKEPDVVDNGAILLGQIEALTQSERQRARALHVLHRLSVAEMGGKRKYRHDLGQSHPSGWFTVTISQP